MFCGAKKRYHFRSDFATLRNERNRGKLGEICCKNREPSKPVKGEIIFSTPCCLCLRISRWFDAATGDLISAV